MKHIPVNNYGLSLLLISLIFLVTNCKNASRPPPNVVFILVDDLGWADLGGYGSTFHKTKNLDRFAKSSLVFTNAYSASPVCSPTRASILTGKHPSRVRITDWIPGDDPKDRKLLGPQDLHELPLAEVTLAEAFKQQGYTTFFAGKWHLGGEGFLPEDQGFDSNIGGIDKGQPPGGYYAPYQNPKLPDGPEGEYLTDRLTSESMRFMEENKDQPFFLFLSYYTVHTPIQANKEYVDHYRTKLSGLQDTVVHLKPEHTGLTVRNQANPAYASMVHALDVNVGRLLDKLEALALSENTIVVFTSDNGGLSTLAGNRVAPTSVKPLRAGKGWCYEGGIRVPLMIRMPGMENRGTTCEVPVVSYDFYPTLLDMAGIPLLPEQHRDGVSLLPLLHGEKEISRDAIFWDYPHYHGSAWTPGAAILMDHWKLIEFYETDDVELYNLSEDIEETQNLAAKYPEKVDALRQKLRETQNDAGSEFPVPNPDYLSDANL